MSNESGERHHSRAFTGFSLIMLILFVVYILQIYLNKPEDRPSTTCWAPYKALKFAMVDIPKIFLPHAPEVALGGAYRAVAFNEACTCFFSTNKIVNPNGVNNGRLACN
jgi:hypothetical protein